MHKSLKHRLGAVVCATALLAGAGAVVQSDQATAQDGSVTMTLLHNNDGESKLLPNEEGGFPGIARFTQKFQELGTETSADILLRVTSGDNFLASKEFAAGLTRDGEPLYDSVALSGLYEAMGLGNHDFDFGPDVTARFIEGFSPAIPFLASNIDVSGEPALQKLADEGRISGSTVFTDPASGLDVGIIGAITPRLPNISSPRNVIVDADVAGAVNAEVEKLQDAGVDRIVLVSHLQGLGEDRDLVPELSGVDIVVAGGGDELLKNDGDTCMEDDEAQGEYPLLLTDADGNEVPVVTAPGGYRCIGQLDVTFDADGNLTDWEGSSVGVPIDGEPEGYALDNVEEPLADALAELEGTVIGTSNVELDGRKSSVRTGPTNVGELLASALLAAGQNGDDFGGETAEVAIQNGGGIRNDAVISAGEITASDTFDIAPFSNFAVTMEVTRERFKELLEVGVAGLPEAEGTYPQIAGFTMDVDPDEPGREVDSDGDCSLNGDEGSRIRTVTLDDGTEIVRDGDVVDGDDLVLATIDFLAGGGDCYPLGDLDFTKVGVSYQQALANFIENDLGGEIDGAAWPAEGGNATVGAISGDDDDDDDADDDPADDEDADDATADDGADAAGDAADDDADAADDAADDDDAELPNTGLDSWMWLIVALTIAAGGAMVWIESRRTSVRSLSTRLATTRAWIPEDSDNG